LTIVNSFCLEPQADLIVRDHVRAGGSCDGRRVGGVIAVPVRDQDQIELADLFRGLRAGWIRTDERVGQDSPATRRVEEKRRMAKPRKRQRLHLVSW
jgi:hypothetical protein